MKTGIGLLTVIALVALGVFLGRLTAPTAPPLFLDGMSHDAAVQRVGELEYEVEELRSESP